MKKVIAAAICLSLMTSSVPSKAFTPDISRASDHFQDFQTLDNLPNARGLLCREVADPLPMSMTARQSDESEVVGRKVPELLEQRAGGCVGHSDGTYTCWDSAPAQSYSGGGGGSWQWWQWSLALGLLLGAVLIIVNVAKQSDKSSSGPPP
jgi:hypothetical protein